MAIVKVIELIAQSEKGWEAAAEAALKEASKTIRGIKNIWVKDMQAIVENGKITNYRITAKLSFTVEKERKA